MPADWTEADVVCPFYHRIRRDHREIVCDPFDGAAAVSTVRFTSMRGMMDFLRTRCSDMDGCQSCRLFQLLMDKAAEDDK